MLFFEGVQMAFKIYVSLVPLIVQAVDSMVHFQCSGYFSGIELVDLAV